MFTTIANLWEILNRLCTKTGMLLEGTLDLGLHAQNRVAEEFGMTADTMEEAFQKRLTALKEAREKSSPKLPTTTK
jgi:hypothetical protein